MLFDIIASIILLGMMAIPLINIIVGIVAGASIAGASGALVGLALAFFVMAAEQMIGLAWPVQNREVGLPDGGRVASARVSSRGKAWLRKRRRTLPFSVHGTVGARRLLGAAHLVDKLRPGVAALRFDRTH
ncbi:MAG: hypothetical protein WC829_11495 [Hyphomicrobium sp.]|jgi:hypothetical protein